MQMRTAIVPMPADNWGGLQQFAVNIREGLADAGWAWKVVVPETAHLTCERLLDNGVDAFKAPLPRFRRSLTKSAKSLIGLFDAARELADSDAVRQATLVQVLGAHHPHGPLIAAHAGKPLVWQLHSNILPKPLRPWVGKIIDWKADSVMTNGEAVFRAFWPQGKSAKEHFVFYAPVDSGRFRPDPAIRANRRASLSIDDQHVLIGTVGNRVWQKNHKFLIDIAERSVDEFPNLRFLILGAKSSSFEQEYASEVIRRAERLNAKVPGLIQLIEPGNQVEQWLPALDVFTLTSHAEGVPLALAEAICTELPVICSEVGSVREVVEAAQCGYTYVPGDYNGYLHSLRQLYASAENRHQLGKIGRENVIRTFSVDAVISAHVAAYDMAISHFQERHQ